MKRSKKYQKNMEKIDRTRQYALSEGIQLLKTFENSSFNETVELSLRLALDTRHSDQQVRGTAVLPHGTGKVVRVLVLTQGESAREAEEAGADFVGSDEYIQKIQEGWLDFDVAIATPDMMRGVGKLGRILGRRGLMPNPKSGTVTQDVGKAVRDAKAGRIEFRTDRGGNIQVPIGKVAFSAEQLEENSQTFLDTIVRLRPSGAKGQYIHSLTLSSTMSPGIRVDQQAIMTEIRQRG
ncbi:MAG: 50S ribosomal protein L1 [Candidatus Latescibacteria bacterium]|nr:50S ribosomal protein L1 [Candidatus Latescibacterota bacterium]MCK5734762.1 50S ribosomal protein L1 [Candidatus Latescibacterota bacterium]